MTSQFQPYLESIRHDYKEWQKRYTLTDAAGKQRQAKDVSPTFDFGLMVQTVKRENREDLRGEEKVERFTVLDGIRKYAEQHVLLVGRPGSGKSTALARLMLEEATTQQVRIPILVELRYWQRSIEELILDSLKRHGLAIASLDSVLSQALILFDGVNELPSEEARSRLSAFRRNHPKLPMIFTTRDLSLGGDLGIEKKLEMQPLTEEQMRSFVRSYLPPEQAEEMLRQLKERLREFGQTPLLLWMLCGLFQQTGTIPENLGIVFRLFTQGYERNLKRDVVIESDRAWWTPVLQQLAWVMMQGETPTEFRVAIGKEEAVRAIAQFLEGKMPYAEDFARKCLRDLQKHHLIQSGTGIDDLEFRHQLIQEYYVAERLLELLPTLSDVEIQKDYLNYLNKTEPLALMLELVENEALAIRVVRLAIEVDCSLGARLAGEVKPEFQKKAVGFVDALDVPKWLKAQLLEKTRSDDAIESLLKLAKDSDSNVRWRAVKTIGEIGSETAVSGLLRLVPHFDLSISTKAVRMIGDIGSETAIPGLLRLVEHFNADVRRGAAIALGKIGSETAVPGLLKLVEDSDLTVCERAVEALGKILGSVEVEDFDSSISESAIESDEIEISRGIPGLFTLLNYSDSTVHEPAWAVFGSMIVGKPIDSGISGLLKLTEYYDDSAVRWNAAFALGEIQSDSAILSLLKLAEDSDSTVRWSAAFALGEIESDSAILSLISLVKHRDLTVRGSAAAMLGTVGSDDAVPGLLKLANHHDSTVRSNVATTLGKIGSDDAISGLLKLADDSHRSVRESAASALSDIGNENAIPGLLKLVEHYDSAISRRAERALDGIAKHCTDIIAQHFPHLLTLISTKSGQEAHRVILAIQKNGKYYNYEIYQAYLEAQKLDRPESQNSDCSNITINIGNLNTGDTTIHGDQIGEQHNHTGSTDDRTFPAS